MENIPAAQKEDKRVFFENVQMDEMAQHFVGNLYRYSCKIFYFTDSVIIYLIFKHRYRENIVVPSSNGPIQIKTNEEKMIEKTVESCAFKSITACVMGMNSTIYITNIIS